MRPLNIITCMVVGLWACAPEKNKVTTQRHDVASPCVPQSCSELGADCGLVDDGCGGTLTCGECSAPASCGRYTSNVCDAPQWEVSVIDDQSTMGTWLDVARDDQDNIIAVYYGRKDEIDGPIFARKTESGWETEAILAGEALTLTDVPGQAAAIAWDGVNGIPYVAYRDDGLENVALAWRESQSGMWKYGVINVGDSIGNVLSVVVDDEGKPHVVSRAENDRYVMNYSCPEMSTLCGSGIIDMGLEGLGGFRDAGRYVDAAMAADGTVHIAYRDDVEDSVRHATWVPGEIAQPTTVEIGDTGYYNSVAIYGSTVHIAYQRTGDTPALQYAVYDGTSWTMETVIEGDAEYSSIKVSPDGQEAAIAFHDPEARSLRYARRLDGVWSIETVDDSATVGRYVAQEIDLANARHLIYWDRTNVDVKYAVLQP